MKTPTQIVYDDDISLQTVHIDIELGNLCNWACTYCPKKSHDGSIPWVDKNNLIKFLDQACTHYKSLGKKYFDFNFLGGEPTLFKHFVEITNWIKQQDNLLGFCFPPIKDVISMKDVRCIRYEIKPWL